jgi:glucose/arabinose dehydrogenase
MDKVKSWILITLVTLAIFSTALFAKADIPLNKLQLPAGFHIEIFADHLKTARDMALGDKGTVFIGSRTDAVYAVIPSKNSPSGRKVKVLLSGLNQPQGVAFYKGDLYVAEVHRIVRYDNIEQHLDNPPSPHVISENFPPVTSSAYPFHVWKTIHFGPDGKLYVAIGALCNSCIPNDERAGTIMQMNPDGSDAKIYAKGVRNSVGFDWDPATHQLWFTDNGRDDMGDNTPPDKLNYAPTPGLDFGFPYYHGKDVNGQPIADPIYGQTRMPEGITWPAMGLPAHVAALGMVFYDGKMFPAKYRNQIFIAEHGSWNRSTKVGYRVSLVNVKNNKAISYQPFITGWEKGGKYWGRPAALLVMPDGSLLVSDDDAGVIYRVTYRQ